MHIHKYTCKLSCPDVFTSEMLQEKIIVFYKQNILENIKKRYISQVILYTVTFSFSNLQIF